MFMGGLRSVLRLDSVQIDFICRELMINQQVKILHHPLTKEFKMREAETETIEFDELKYETDEAWLVVIDDEEYWFPKSQCELLSDNEIEAPVWLLEKNGLA